MKITNIHNLPEPFVKLVTFDQYSRGKSQFTTTEIIGPPKHAILNRRHDHEIEMDVSFRVWSMSGSAKHYLLQEIAEKEPERYIAEQRYYIEVFGKILGGQLDLYDKQTKTLYDYKETKVWKVTKGDKKDWDAQANINAYILKQNGIEVEKIEYLAFLKDWSDSETGREGYPMSPSFVIPFEIWPEEKTKAFIEDRARLHMNFQQLEDDEIPVCSPEERWEGKEFYRVIQDGAKKAIAKFPNENNPSQDDAKRNAEAKAMEMNCKPKSKGGYKVERVTPEPTRCLRFCPANRFCSFYQNYIAKTIDS